MNRKQRRAARNRGERTDARAGSSINAHAAALYAEAVRHHQAGRLSEAEALCRETLASDRRHVGALYLLGVIAQQRGRHQEAAGYYRDVIRLEPGVAVAHHELGRVLAIQGKIDEASAAVEQA